MTGGPARVGGADVKAKEGCKVKAGLTPEQLADQRRVQIPTQRFGNPAEFGELCAFVCSVQAGYLTGQNLLIDGGAYPGTY